SQNKTALLGHDKEGPKLTVRCHEFLTQSEEQVRLWWRSAGGWNWLPTIAYTMESLDIDNELDVYIRQSASYYLQNVLDGSDALSHIFKMASCYMDQTNIQLSLKMWAANRLLMKGWEISGGDEFLGMTIVNEPSSLLHNTIPAPRVLQNQLDHLLERQIFETEHKLLKELQKLIRRHDRGQWVVVFLALVIVLHILERDTWRLMYWAFSWRHPLKPIHLIDKSVYFSNLLLAHFYYAAAGSLPLAPDWDAKSTRDLVQDRPVIVNSMKALQAHARHLSKSIKFQRPSLPRQHLSLPRQHLSISS
ncbi:hypothetical protein BKA64DRAFT_756964, partial [Cadophora sp. MPI-SDFR-AT-0126]